MSRKIKSTAEPPWFRVRGYRHFDKPLKKPKVLLLVQDPEYISKHAFLPFIHYEKRDWRYKRAKGKVEVKVRPIAFASHFDSHVFAYYSSLLQARYENWLLEAGLSENVLAYRTFNPPKCNIHFALEAFAPLKAADCDHAIGMDVEGFFDNLDHQLLRDRCREVLGVRHLPADHYKVFRAITKFSKVDLYKALAALNIGVRRLREGRAPLCSMMDFRTKIRENGLIVVNLGGKGIPQGSPISAVLSNIYMMDFDKEASAACEAVGGSYRRYSDDILVLCRKADGPELEKSITDSLAKIKLTAQPSKTTRATFRTDINGQLIADRPFQYLGLMFDGERVMMRSQTLARFHRRIRKAVYYAGKKAKQRTPVGCKVRVFRRDLYDKYSHLGESNFLSYASRVSAVAKDNSAKNQVRGHWKLLEDLIREAETRNEG